MVLRSCPHTFTVRCSYSVLQHKQKLVPYNLLWKLSTERLKTESLILCFYCNFFCPLDDACFRKASSFKQKFKGLCFDKLYFLTTNTYWNWGYEELRYFVFIHVPGENNCRWLRSLFLLCSCNIFQALINSFVSWFWKVSQLIFFGTNDRYCCFVMSHLWILLHDHFLECHQLLINYVDTYKSWGKCWGLGGGTNDVMEKKQGRRGKNCKHVFTCLIFTVMFLLSNTSGYGSEFQLYSYIINHHSSKHKKHANNLPSTEQAAKTQPKQDKSFSFIYHCF